MLRLLNVGKQKQNPSISFLILQCYRRLRYFERKKKKCFYERILISTWLGRFIEWIWRLDKVNPVTKLRNARLHPMSLEYILSLETYLASVNQAWNQFLWALYKLNYIRLDFYFFGWLLILILEIFENVNKSLFRPCWHWHRTTFMANKSSSLYHGRDRMISKFELCGAPNILMTQTFIGKEKKITKGTKIINM